MLIFMNLFLPIFMFIVGILVFSMKYKHLLSTLLSLEFIVLSLFYLMCVYFMNFNHEYFFTMIFLTFSVCEGALGLSILVSMIRTHGNDYFQSFNILQC
uniref:NADH-ubiquinone oxidoreductase chain 4L n=1 Tax=Polystoechotes punctata TaxID=2028677 RepID=B5U4F8_9NEOP|nr:NADH dehydrogenase subunit 4L [Polystoechotes punctata]ACH90010.1 NADH dehydrogenase subunit 4L [Polystoechotes punctata]